MVPETPAGRHLRLRIADSSTGSATGLRVESAGRRKKQLSGMNRIKHENRQAREEQETSGKGTKRKALKVASDTEKGNITPHLVVTNRRFRIPMINEGTAPMELPPL